MCILSSTFLAEALGSRAMIVLCKLWAQHFLWEIPWREDEAFHLTEFSCSRAQQWYRKRASDRAKQTCQEGLAPVSSSIWHLVNQSLFESVGTMKHFKIFGNSRVLSKSTVQDLSNHGCQWPGSSVAPSWMATAKYSGSRQMSSFGRLGCLLDCGCDPNSVQAQIEIGGLCWLEVERASKIARNHQHCRKYMRL